MDKIKKNLGLQTIYEVLIIIFPIITSPYISRVLGAENLGVFSYTNSIVSYFTMFAYLGVVNYGTRSISEVQTDLEARNKVFSEIFILKTVTSLVALFAYLIYCVVLCRDNLNISIIMGVEILSALININWLHYGIENFKATTLRNIVIKLITTILIFVFVKNKEDLYIYVLLMVGNTFVTYLSYWYGTKHLIRLQFVPFKDVLTHLKPNIMLFIPLAAMSVYHTMDKTMLGILSTYTQGGYYFNADRAVNIPVGVLMGITTVLLPRVTALLAEGKREAYKEIFSVTLEGMLLTSIILSFGIMAIAKEFTPVFFGEGYDSCINLIKLLSVVMIIKAISYSLRYLYLVPHHQEKKYITSVCVGAGMNLCANTILIPYLGATGAVLGTLLAEGSACFTQFIYCKGNIDLKIPFYHSIVYIVIGICMYFLIRISSTVTSNSLIGLLIEIVIGGSFSLFAVAIYWKLSNNILWKLIKNGKY